MSILEQGVTGMYRPGAAKIKAQRQQRHQVASPEPLLSAAGKLKNRQAARPGCTSQKRGFFFGMYSGTQPQQVEAGQHVQGIRAQGVSPGGNIDNVSPRET